MLTWVLLSACNGPDDPIERPQTDPTLEETGPWIPPAEDWDRNLISANVTLDLVSHAGSIHFVIEGSEDRDSVSLDTPDLSITGVEDAEGPTDFLIRFDRLDARVPRTTDDIDLYVDFAFDSQIGFYGWMANRGVTYLFPDECGTLFPCNPDPGEGLTFTLDVQGAGPGQTAIYPSEIVSDAPTYMVGLAVGDFTEVSLGTTTAGTEVSSWHLPGSEDRMAEGTAHLVEVFDFFEQTYGPYLFGNKVGSVEAAWGFPNFGGAEHHPFWHVADTSLPDIDLHTHLAAHGWFGNGVRMACWEDLVMADGVSAYLAAHALETLGIRDLWSYYGITVAQTCGDYDAPAMPEGCSTVAAGQLFAAASYWKGACFMEDVGDLVGIEALDDSLARFYGAYAGDKAGMQDLIDTLVQDHPAQSAAIEILVEEWLTNSTCPADAAQRCSTHQ